MKLPRPVRRALLAITASALAFAGFGVANNNLPRTTLSRAQFDSRLNHAYETASEWVRAQDREGNTYLTHMVASCASLSGDPRLKAHVERVAARDPDPYFGRMIDPLAPYRNPSDGFVSQLSDYQRWLLHGLSRKEFVLTESDRAEMFRPGKLTGRATHQLFALMFYRQFNGSTPELARLIRQVSEGIAQEAGFDFRVTDLYLQRITFLLAAGHPDLVQPRWVERALAHQEPSGGWFLGWYGWQPTPYRFALEEVEHSHATSQGLWFTCMLKYRYPDWAAQHYM